MERHFDVSLKEIQSKLMVMAGYVESAVDLAISSLQTGDVTKIKNVAQIEALINEDQMGLDNACVKHLALQHPLAADLRLIVAIIKINSDLERMGDQAVNISHNAEHYLKGSPLKPLIDLPKMCEEVKHM